MKQLLVLTLATSLLLASCYVLQPTINWVTYTINWVAYLSGSVSYYQNGIVRAGILAKDTEIDGIIYAAKTTIQFHENGKVYQGILDRVTDFSKDQINTSISMYDIKVFKNVSVYFNKRRYPNKTSWCSTHNEQGMKS